jgi:hypothetical protein
VAAGLVAVLLGPTAYAIQTVGRTESGAIPTSGPISAAADGPGGGRFGNRGAGFAPGAGFTPPAGFTPGAAFGPGGGAGDNGGGASAALVSYLKANQQGATWLVAVGSANQGASLELSSGRAVLAMGGFSGGDPAMTVARLQQLVASGQLRYVLTGGGPGGGLGALPGGPTSAGAGADGGNQSVMTWVTQHCRPVDATASGSSGLYDCSTTT